MQSFDSRQIAAGAELLHDRLQHNHFGETGQTSTPAQFQSLYENSTFGDVQEREAISGLTPQTLREASRFNVWPADESLPAWTERLSDLTDAVANDPPWQPPDSITDSPVPFVDIVGSLVQLVRRGQDWTKLGETEQFASTALQPAYHWLLIRLSKQLAQPLHLEFRVYALDHGHQVGEDYPASEKPPSKTAYDAFVGSLRAGEFATFLKRYPVAARRTAVTIEQWQTSLEELIGRIEDDWETIIDTFGLPKNATITEILPGRGDIHEGGRSVTELRLSSGDTIYYKPRDIGTDILFDGLISYLESECSVEFVPSVPGVLDMDGYGWAKAVRSVDDIGDPSQYYSQVGGLICLYYILNGTDLHFENIVATPDGPCVIDSETLLTRSKVQEYLPDEMASHKTAKMDMEDSVFRTALLPIEMDTDEVTPEVHGNDVSGLTRLEGQETHQVSPDWTQVNTDKMTFSLTPIRRESADNFPRRNGSPVPPNQYLDDILTGFERVYSVLQQLTAAEITDVVPRDIDTIPTRFLFRNTAGYSALQLQLRTPQSQTNGIEAGLVLERSVPELQILTTQGQRVLQPLLAAERRSLLEENIPRFTIRQRNLCYRDEIILHEFFDRTHSEMIEYRVSNLSDADLQKQIEYIRTALRGRSEYPEAHQ